MQVRRVLALSVVTLFVSAALPALAQRNNDASKQPTRSAQEQQDIQALVQTVELALLSDLGIQVPAPGAPPPQTPPTAKPLTLGAPDSSQGEVPIKWESNHFVKGQTDTYIPFTLAARSRDPGVGRRDSGSASSTSSRRPRLRRSSRRPVPRATTRTSRRPSRTDVRVGQRQLRGRARGRQAVARDPAQAGSVRGLHRDQGEERRCAAANQRERSQPQRSECGRPRPPPGKVGLLRHEITVPDFGVADLTTSSVILARSVEQVAAPPTDQESNPYVFGPMRIVPSPDGKFAKSAELSVIFWIYDAQAAATGKPDVTIDYNFHQKLAEGEKYFNKTAPQQLNAQTLPPEFNVAAGHQLPGSLVVPLSSFPAADYRLEIKITDKASGKSVTQNVNFSVLPG